MSPEPADRFAANAGAGKGSEGAAIRALRYIVTGEMESIVLDRGDPLDHCDVLFERMIREHYVADGEFGRRGDEDHVVRFECWTHRVAGDPDRSKAP